ncbi:MAG: molecular chaperone SurA [Rhodospirillaceae bacterium]|nr:molecular chaperone SurA [Rhodospirillaceae bacterium]|tara:strand:+ start:7185 stop:8522 length:1338 start_codon:yes stop_codon:yes gene_type:complete
MKKIIPVLTTLIIQLTVIHEATSQTRELGGTGELLDGVAAIVDQGVVLRSELNEKVSMVVGGLLASQEQLPPAQRRPIAPLPIIEEQVLESLIIQQIQLQRAQRYGITVGDGALNQALTTIAQRNGVTLEQMPAALADEGMNYAMFREETRDQMIVEQLLQREVMAEIVVAPREMELCLARSTTQLAQELEYNISHILIGISGTATSAEVNQARDEATEIVQRLQAGESFEDIALTHSDAQTALDGGSLGWREGSQLPTLFADTVILMNPGEHSDPIQSGSGFHIVKLNDLRGTQAQAVMVDQLHVRHILIEPTEVMDDTVVQQRLGTIREQILNGDDFAAVAQNVSDDPAAGANGGDMGFVDPNVFVPEFLEVIQELEENELSEPFRTRYGWHIAEVLGARSYDTSEELKEQRCVAQIRSSKAEEEQALWLRRLRDEAFVEVRI